MAREDHTPPQDHKRTDLYFTTAILPSRSSKGSHQMAAWLSGSCPGSNQGDSLTARPSVVLWIGGGIQFQ